jgi:hypothetical protein
VQVEIQCLFRSRKFASALFPATKNIQQEPNRIIRRRKQIGKKPYPEFVKYPSRTVHAYQEEQRHHCRCAAINQTPSAYHEARPLPAAPTILPFPPPACLLTGSAMDDGGIQEEAPSARLLAPTRSGGSRWVDGSEVDSSESAQWSIEDEQRSAEDSSAGIVPSRVSSGGFRRRFGKRPRRVDSLDVEAMNVHGAHGHGNKVRSLPGQGMVIRDLEFSLVLPNWNARVSLNRERERKKWLTEDAGFDHFLSLPR